MAGVALPYRTVVALLLSSMLVLAGTGAAAEATQPANAEDEWSEDPSPETYEAWLTEAVDQGGEDGEFAETALDHFQDLSANDQERAIHYFADPELLLEVFDRAVTGDPDSEDGWVDESKYRQVSF